MSAQAAVYISGTVGPYVSLGVHTAVIGDVCVRIAEPGQLTLCMSIHVPPAYMGVCPAAL